MASMSVELNEAQMETLRRQAEGRGRSVEEHLQRLVAQALERTDAADFERASEHVLAENAELYERLS